MAFDSIQKFQLWEYIPQQTAPKNYPILLCDISKDKRAGTQGCLAKYPCSFISGISLWVFFIRYRKDGKERTLIGPPPSIIEGDVKNRSSTSSAIGVVLHRRQKLYFIVKGSSTAPKGTKTVFSFRHPKPPLKLCFRLGNLKNIARAQYIYNEREEKFHFILKKVVAMLVKRPKPMYLCNRKQGGTLLKRVPMRFAPWKRGLFFERFT